MKNIILGIDLSTSCVGITLYSHDGELILMEGLNLKTRDNSKLKGIEALFSKKMIFEIRFNEIEDMIKGVYNDKISRIVIEEPLIQSNNASTVAVLLKFNGIISNFLYERTGILPEYISSYDARIYSFPELYAVRVFNKKNEKLPREIILKDINKGKLVLFGNFPFAIDKKSVIQNEIYRRFPDIKWEYNKKGELIKETYDATDSLAVVLAAINKDKYMGEKPVIVNSTIEGDKIEYDTRFPNDMDNLVYHHLIVF
jgi:Holliday junction resolvasome RuvABC endonuclease subunit